MAETVVRRRGEPRRGPMARTLLGLSRVVNPLLLTIARTGVIPLWGAVGHRGRRSGRRYETPVAVLATRDAFLIPLPYGPGTDWCRNLLAAGGGTVRWRGADYRVSDLAVVDERVVRASLTPALRVVVPKLGITRFLRARRSA